MKTTIHWQPVKAVVGNPLVIAESKGGKYEIVYRHDPRYDLYHNNRFIGAYDDLVAAYHAAERHKHGILS